MEKAVFVALTLLSLRFCCDVQWVSTEPELGKIKRFLDSFQIRALPVKKKLGWALVLQIPNNNETIRCYNWKTFMLCALSNGFSEKWSLYGSWIPRIDPTDWYVFLSNFAVICNQSESTVFFPAEFAHGIIRNRT